MRICLSLSLLADEINNTISRFFFAHFIDRLWVIFPMAKSMCFSKSQEKNSQIKEPKKKYQRFVTSYLQCATANCIFAFQILKCAY